MAMARRMAGFALLGLLLGAGACEEETAGGAGIALPSGRAVAFLDIITDTAGTQGATARFRFVDASLKAGEDRSADMQALCDSYALSRIDAMVPAPQQIVISLADRELPFGEANPEAVQLFEAYNVTANACIWEIF